MTTRKLEALRQRAETFLGQFELGSAVEGAVDLRRLLYELEVHEVELQLQNEDLRATQLRLEASRDSYAAIYDGAPVGYLTVDEVGTILEANAMAGRLLRPDLAALKGRRLVEFVALEDRDILHLHLRGLSGTGAVATCEVRGYGADIDDRVFELRSHLAAHNGRGHKVWTVLSDVTERSRMLHAIRESEARLRAIFDAATDAILVVDEDGSIESCNAASSEIFRLPQASLVGRKLREFIPGVSLAPLAGGPAAHGRVESSARRADGSSLLVEIGVGQHRATRPPKVAVFVRDISEARALERELRQSQKMGAIGRLASGLAHDFNNTLMAITGCADAALEMLTPATRPHALVERAREVAFRGAGLTRGLLALGHRKDAEEEEALSDLNEVIARMEGTLRHLAGRDVMLQVALAPEGAWAALEEAELEQILLNLLSNARDAMPGGGRLTLSTQFADSRVSLTVRDEGKGMDAETKAHAFEPFFTTKVVGEGTGLGLAMVHAIVLRRGGNIDLESAPGKGTSLTLHFTRRAPPEEEAHDDGPLEPAPPMFFGATVLLAEDEDVIRENVTHQLERANLRVLAASDGRRALEIAETHEGPIDILLTDMVMPGMGGDELSRRIGALRPGTQTIAMSAFPPEKLRAEGRIDPETEALTKPFTAQALVRALHGRLAARVERLRPRRGVPSSAREGGTILLVEDDADIRRCLTDHLAGHGFRVLAACDECEALAVFRAHREEIDLVLADVHLPDGSGPGAVARMRSERNDVPALYVSGDRVDAELLDPTHPAKSAFLEKPVSIDALDGLVAQLLRTTCGLRRPSSKRLAQHARE